jgi:hypothetical protein
MSRTRAADRPVNVSAAATSSLTCSIRFRRPGSLAWADRRRAKAMTASVSCAAAHDAIRRAAHSTPTSSLSPSWDSSPSRAAPAAAGSAAQAPVSASGPEPAASARNPARTGPGSSRSSGPPAANPTPAGPPSWCRNPAANASPAPVHAGDMYSSARSAGRSASHASSPSGGLVSGSNGSSSYGSPSGSPTHGSSAPPPPPLAAPSAPLALSPGSTVIPVTSLRSQSVFRVSLILSTATDNPTRHRTGTHEREVSRPSCWSAPGSRRGRE